MADTPKSGADGKYNDSYADDGDVNVKEEDDGARGRQTSGSKSVGAVAASRAAGTAARKARRARDIFVGAGDTKL